MFRFHPQGIHDEEEESDIVRAIPRSSQHPRGQLQFGTVIAIINETAESTGLAGKRPIIAIYKIIKKFCQGTRVGHIQVIFTLPEEVQSITGI